MQQNFQDFDKTIQKNKQSTKLTYIFQHILMLIDKLSNKANKDNKNDLSNFKILSLISIFILRKIYDKYLMFAVCD